MTPTPPATRTAPEPVDWGLAERVARRIAGREPLATSYLGPSIARDFTEVTVQAEAAVTELTGLRPPTPAVATVLDRGGWVGANVTSMRHLLAPFSERVGERMAASPVAPVGRRIAGAELGFLLGYVAQRVLGQYDLLVFDDPTSGISDDAVYYVGPNVLGLEKRYAFRPRDFRLWIALHELTHRAQFTGVPWLKDYFLGLVGELVGGVEPDPRRMIGAVAPCGRRDAPGPQPDRRGRRRVAVRVAGAARDAGQGAGADVAARGPRQRGDEPARRGAGRRPGAHGAASCRRGGTRAARPRCCTG